MKFKKYLKSCFIALMFTLLYIIFVTRFIDSIAQQTELFVILSASLIFISGIIAPLTFLLSGRYTTSRKESARPDITASDNAISPETSGADPKKTVPPEQNLNNANRK
ncbi:hypothetical protein [Succinimonas sp.]|uniref:hypothetical protein n=1 Tax=Succinimonas sp. TaxID=1936151 RepID=UPI0038638F7B